MGKHERILIADDNPVVRRGLRALFESDGHTVVGEAGSVDEVKSIVDDPDNDMTLVTIDSNMPKKGDGERASAYIGEKRPHVIRVAISSAMPDFGDYRVIKTGDYEGLLNTIRNAQKPA